MSPLSERTAPPSFGEAEQAEAARLVELALEEDLPAGDITCRVLLAREAGSPGSADRTDPAARFAVVARESGVLAGLPVATLLYQAIDERVRLEARRSDGTRLKAGEPFLELCGPASSILGGERVALNFLQHLSGIATLTAQWVEALRGTGAVLLDTRKTLPGWRHLEKYAVRAGGGTNHRRNLSEAILLKDNHARVLRAAGGSRLADWVAVLRREAPGIFLEVEVESREEFLEARRLDVDAILLDNFSLEDLRWAVERNRAGEQSPQGGFRRPLLEASGGWRLEQARDVARTGVDRISVGQLTHSARALDMSMEVVEVLER